MGNMCHKDQDALSIQQQQPIPPVQPRKSRGNLSDLQEAARDGEGPPADAGVSGPSEVRRIFALGKAFEEVDADNSGLISLEEFEAMGKALNGEGWEASQEFRLMDRDASGELDKHEWVIYFTKVLAPVSDEDFNYAISEVIRAARSVTAPMAHAGAAERVPRWQEPTLAAAPPPSASPEPGAESSVAMRDSVPLLSRAGRSSATTPMGGKATPRIARRIFALGKSFDEVDADDSGRISWDEFAAMGAELDGSEAGSELRRLFQMMDKDGSGDIDKEEWVAYLLAQLATAPDHDFRSIQDRMIHAGQLARKKLKHAQAIAKRGKYDVGLAPSPII